MLIRENTEGGPAKHKFSCSSSFSCSVPCKMSTVSTIAWEEIQQVEITRSWSTWQARAPNACLRLLQIIKKELHLRKCSSALRTGVYFLQILQNYMRNLYSNFFKKKQEKGHPSLSITQFSADVRCNNSIVHQIW
jgi:hypothetical protein